MILAVESWMWKKLDEDGLNKLFTIITSLPKPCQYIYACRNSIYEIANGGLNQLFYNTRGKFASIAEEGFYEISANKLSKYMNQANEIYIKNKVLIDNYYALIDAYYNGMIKSLPKSHEEGSFGGLDQVMYDESEDCGFDSLCVAYIRKNYMDFGE